MVARAGGTAGGRKRVGEIGETRRSRDVPGCGAEAGAEELVKGGAAAGADSNETIPDSEAEEEGLEVRSSGRSDYFEPVQQAESLCSPAVLSDANAHCNSSR